MNQEGGRRQVLTERQVDAWCISETDGHPVRLESLGRVGTGDDGVVARDHTVQRVSGNEGCRPLSALGSD